PLPRGRRLVRVLDRLVARHASALPGRARAQSGAVALAGRRGLQLPLESALPAHVRTALRDRKLHRPRRVAGARRHRQAAGPVRSTLSRAIAPPGPLVAGLLLGAASPRATIAVFAASGLVLALWGTLSPAIRAAPSLDELASAGP